LVRYCRGLMVTVRYGQLELEPAVQHALPVWTRSFALRINGLALAPGSQGSAARVAGIIPGSRVAVIILKTPRPIHNCHSPWIHTPGPKTSYSATGEKVLDPHHPHKPAERHEI